MSITIENKKINSTNKNELNVFWNKVKLLVEDPKYDKFKLPRPCLSRQTHKTCTKCNNYRVSEYDHNICLKCSIFEKESIEYRYHYPTILDMIN